MTVESNTPQAHNRRRIREIAAQAPSDLEALARLFEDDGLLDDGTVVGRTRAILAATGRRTIPGLQTALPFGDTGFGGERRLGGLGLRDPWPASRNQPGHFLTAVGLRLTPELVARSIPLLGSIRRLVGAPGAMPDAEVALRLTIGHEKVADPPNGVEAALLVLAGLCVALRWEVGRDGTAPQRVRRLLWALLRGSLEQIVGSLLTFRRQFAATTAADLEAWTATLHRVATPDPLDWRALASGRLHTIQVGDGEGNSRQDLLLSMAGWTLGELIASGAFSEQGAVGDWIRRSLA